MPEVLVITCTTDAAVAKVKSDGFRVYRERCFNRTRTWTNASKSRGASISAKLVDANFGVTDATAFAAFLATTTGPRRFIEFLDGFAECPCASGAALEREAHDEPLHYCACTLSLCRTCKAARQQAAARKRHRAL